MASLLQASFASLKFLTAVTRDISAATDGMRRPVSGRDAVSSQVIDVLEAQIKRRPAMKKISNQSSGAEQEYFAAETDPWIGSGRSQQLVLRGG